MPSGDPAQERVFLCASPWRLIYPMEQHGDFDTSEHVVAAAEGAVPLLWLALFRAGELSTGLAPSDDGTERDWPSATAPLVDREQALTNLAASVPALDRLFGPAVSQHTDLLRQAMRWFPGKWMTIEWWIGDSPAPPDPAQLRSALGAFDDPTRGPGELGRLCRLRPDALPQPPRPGTPLLPYLTEQAAGLRHLLGHAFMTMVPWEQPI